MRSKENEVSPGQVFIFIISAQISFGILSIASTLAEKVGHDGWIAILFAGLINSFLIYIIHTALRRFGNLSIMEINTHLFGKYIGNFLNVVIIGYITYATILSVRLFSDVIKLSTLPLTPAVVLSSFIIIPIVYLSWYGLKYICRFCSLKLALLIVVPFYYFLLLKYFRLSFLQPIAATGLMPIIKNVYTPFVSFMGYELISIIYPYITDKKKSLSFSLYANLFTTTFYLVTVVFLTGFFGEVMLTQLQYPIFSLARAYRAPVLERLDLFFISLWFPIMGTAVQVYYFSAYQSIKKLLKIQDDKKKCKMLLAVFTIFVIILSRQPKDMISVYKLFDILGYIGTAYTIHIIICYLISFIKPGGKKSEASV